MFETVACHAILDRACKVTVEDGSNVNEVKYDTCNKEFEQTIIIIMDNAFRKIDIDVYDEDVLQENELYEADPRGPSQILSDAKQKQVAVRSFLAKGDISGAITIALENAPYGPNVEEAKNLTLQILVGILNSTKATEVPTVVKSLSQDAQDTLMKYLYKGMGLPGWGDVSGSVLLGWHEKLTEVAGTGCIVRVMTDRRHV